MNGKSIIANSPKSVKLTPAQKKLLQQLANGERAEFDHWQYIWRDASFHYIRETVVDALLDANYAQSADGYLTITAAGRSALDLDPRPAAEPTPTRCRCNCGCTKRTHLNLICDDCEHGRHADAPEPTPAEATVPLTDAERETVERIRKDWRVIDQHDRELGLGESGYQKVTRELLTIIDRLSGKARQSR